MGFFNISVCYPAIRLQSNLVFVVPTSAQGGQMLQMEGMSLLMGRGGAGAGAGAGANANPFHLVHWGFTTAAKSREWRKEEILG